MNFFPSYSNNNMAKLMPHFEAESIAVYELTQSKKACAVYFSLIYYFAISKAKQYSNGYRYLSQMSGCSTRWLTPTLKLLHDKRLINLTIVNHGKVMSSNITLRITSTQNTQLLLRKVHSLYYALLHTNCIVSNENELRGFTNPPLNNEDNLENIRENVDVRGMLPPERGLAAVAAQGGSERVLQNCGISQIELEKFFNSIRTELLEYDKVVVEKYLTTARRSIRSRTKINNVGAYLNAVKTDILTKVKKQTASSLLSNKKDVQLSIFEEEQQTTCAAKVRDITQPLEKPQSGSYLRDLLAQLERMDREVSGN